MREKALVIFSTFARKINTVPVNRNASQNIHNLKTILRLG